MIVRHDGIKWNVFMEKDGLYMESIEKRKKMKVTMDFDGLNENEVVILNHSEYQGVVEALIYGGVIDPKPVGFVDLGFIKPRIYSLSKDFLKSTTKGTTEREGIKEKECFTQTA